MAYRCVGLDFTVGVDGGFAGGRDWEVRAVVAYRTDMDLARAERSLVAARSAVVTGVLREAREGLRLGAGRVRVRIEGDPVVSGTFTMSRPVTLRDPAA